MGPYTKALNDEETKEAGTVPNVQAVQAEPGPYVSALQSAGSAAQPTQAAALGQTTADTQQTATYIDDNGNKQTGYVSALSNDGDLNYWQRMEKYYNDQYEAAKAANDAAAQAKYEAAMEQINAKIRSLEDTYAGTNRQLYRDYMFNQKSLPQQLSAMGYSGGLSESGNIRLRNSYEEALAENERSKAGQIAELNAQGVQYRYDADAEAARLNAEADQLRRSYLTALVQKQREEGLAQAREVGDATGDYSRLLEYGYSQEEVDAFKKAWIQANPELAAALGYIKKEKSGGGRRTTSTDDQTTSTGITIDYDSITKLGRGPINANTLSRLVESGQVIESINNGRVSYKNNKKTKQTQTNPFSPQSIANASGTGNVYSRIFGR